MTDDRCNGWTNRETWSLMLWINNDEGLQGEARRALSFTGAGHDNGPNDFRDWVEATFTRSGYEFTYGDAWPDTLADIACEIGSLDRINYAEAAASILQDIAETDSYAS